MVRSTRRSRARRWLVGTVALATLLAASLVGGSTASAGHSSDMVLDWNGYAVAALSNPPTATPPGAGQPPTVAILHMAMVQGAIYDAVNAIDRRYESFLRHVPKAPRWASKPAATATAAHHVLVGLAPALSDPVKADLDAKYAASLAEIKDGRAKRAGVRIGAAVAALMLKKRADDGRYVPFAFTTGTAPGQWRPDLPSFVNDPFAWVANVRPFTLKRTSQFRTKGPYALTSAEYAAEFNEVKALGALNGSTRTEAQTILANFHTTNPLVMYHRGFRELAAERGMSVARQARLFAMLSVSAADAMIGCWDDKEHWGFWRPITAIRGAADDGNPATEPQADWLPLAATPPYPDHPSGYNCFTGATMQAAREYFRTDKVDLDLTNAAMGMTITYHRFSAVWKDTIEARMLNGLHFRNPDVQGAWLGRSVAKWVARHHFERD